MSFLIGLLLGIYIGGGIVTNIVVGETVDGREPTLLEKICMPLFWPFTLWTAGEPDEP